MGASSLARCRTCHVRVVQIYIYFDHLGMQGALAERKHVVDGERVSCFVETGVPFSERKKNGSSWGHLFPEEEQSFTTVSRRSPCSIILRGEERQAQLVSVQFLSCSRSGIVHACSPKQENSLQMSSCSRSGHRRKRRMQITPLFLQGK
jgi:hypothetical protein